MLHLFDILGLITAMDCACVCIEMIFCIHGLPVKFCVTEPHGFQKSGGASYFNYLELTDRCL